MVTYAKPPKPVLYATEPFKKTTEIAKAYAYEQEKVLIPNGTLSIEIENGYEDGFEITFHGEDRDDPNYETKLAVFEREKKKHDQRVSEWELECKEIDKKNEKIERETYERLKNRYGRDFNG